MRAARPRRPAIEPEIQGGNVTQIRAADDFAAIRARMKELAQEAAEASAENADANRADNPAIDRDRRQKDRREGHPPPWAPTIFTKPLVGRR
jgi:hypothetical protein